MRPLTSSQSTTRLARRCARYSVLFFVASNVVLFFLFFEVYFSVIVRYAYNFNTIVLPVCLGVAAIGVWLATRRIADPRPLRRVAIAWLLCAVVLAWLRVYATHIEPHQLQVRELTIRSSKITQPFTLLHMTDLQSPGIGPYEEKVFERIRTLNPDLILDTGDLLQPVAPRTYFSELPKLADLFESLHPPMGMYTVTGDTTGPIGNATPEQGGGIQYLHTQGTVVEFKGQRVRVFGLDLYDSTRDGSPAVRPNVEAWYNEDPTALNILMGHRPDFILEFNDLPFDLCLAGHTHGGQIRIPFFGPPVTFTHVPRDWARGFRKVGRTWLNVSAGIGAEHDRGLPSIRINCPPEMTFIRFEPAGPS